MPINRRTLLASGLAVLTTSRCLGAAEAGQALEQKSNLAREVGITVSSLSRVADGTRKISILEWPQMLREELDLKVIDLNSAFLPSRFWSLKLS